MLGTTGFVLGAVPMKDEAACIIIDTLTRLVETTRLQCVENISVDFATMELHHSLSVDFPRFRAHCEDPAHLVMKFKTANGNHASPASCRVSRVVAKFSIHGLVVTKPRTVAVAASARQHRVPCSDGPSHVRV